MQNYGEGCTSFQSWLRRVAEPLGRGEAYCGYHTGQQHDGVVVIHSDDDEDDDDDNGACKCIVCGADALPGSPDGCCPECAEQIKMNGHACVVCGDPVPRKEYYENDNRCADCYDPEASGEIVVTKTMTFEERFEEGAKNAIDLTADDNDDDGGGDDSKRINGVPASSSSMRGSSAVRPSRDDASSFLAYVKRRCRNDLERHSAFLSLMGDFKQQKRTVDDTIAATRELFMDDAELVDGFNAFLPDSQRVDTSDFAKVVFGKYTRGLAMPSARKRRRKR